MKALATLVLAAIASAAVAQSSLPACSGSDVSLVTNCHAASTFPSGASYELFFPPNSSKEPKNRSLSRTSVVSLRSNKSWANSVSCWLTVEQAQKS